MTAISVLIPIYNAEPFLEQCLDSIAHQTFADIEVLCINDGSKDNSLEIIEGYAGKDPRFKVLDKPNGGYGKALNYGLERATGEYVSIIEPDDFIERNMYSDLYAFATKSLDHPIDVAKGSYFEYYDARDGFKEAIQIPNLKAFMPKEPAIFTLEDNAEIIRHHPSIWSAIYRRGFLEDNGIRFVEPKGAGWADNPFLIETLVKAQEIAWVPKGYYYYRQTNPGASSFLKDYKVPFDRMREMRAILKRCNVSSDVWAAHYTREFNYIYSVIGEFGFCENDPKIAPLIKETLDAMDEKIVLNHPAIPSDFIRYYVEFLGKAPSSTIGSHAPEASPDVTFILPLHNSRKYILQCILSLASESDYAFEALCIECGSTDRGLDLCSRCIKHDQRFRILDKRASSVPEGINEALSQAKGRYVFILSPKTALRENVINQLIFDADQGSYDIIICDSLKKFAVDAWRAAGKPLPSSSHAPRDSEGESEPDRTYGPLTVSSASEFLFNMTQPSSYSAFYRASFIRDNQLAFDVCEKSGACLFNAKALLCASSFAYKAIWYAESLEVEEITIPFHLAILRPPINEEPLIAPAIKKLANLLGNDLPLFGRSFSNLALEATMWDAATRRSYESLCGYTEHELIDMQPLIDRFLDGSKCYDGYDFAKYQLLTKQGVDAYMTETYLEHERDIVYLRRELEDLTRSVTFQTGTKVAELAKRIIPSRITGKIRSIIATTKR